LARRWRKTVLPGWWFFKVSLPTVSNYNEPGKIKIIKLKIRSPIMERVFSEKLGLQVTE